MPDAAAFGIRFRTIITKSSYQPALYFVDSGRLVDGRVTIITSNNPARFCDFSM